MNQAAPKTIVIVDDTPENLHLLAEMLDEQGYRVRSAPNGERALATVQKERPDMILPAVPVRCGRHAEGGVGGEELGQLHCVAHFPSIVI